MATQESASAALLAAIENYASNAGPNRGEVAKNLAEAWAWLQYPAQPHGGSTSVRSS